MTEAPAVGATVRPRKHPAPFAVGDQPDVNSGGPIVRKRTGWLRLPKGSEEDSVVMRGPHLPVQLIWSPGLEPPM